MFHVVNADQAGGWPTAASLSWWCCYSVVDHTTTGV